MSPSDDDKKPELGAGIMVHKKIKRRKAADADEDSTPPASPRGSGILKPRSRRRTGQHPKPSPEPEDAAPPSSRRPEPEPEPEPEPVPEPEPEPVPEPEPSDAFEDPFADAESPFTEPLDLSVLDKPAARRRERPTVEFAPPSNLLDSTSAIEAASASVQGEEEEEVALSSSRRDPSAFLEASRRGNAPPPPSSRVNLEPADDFFDEGLLAAAAGERVDAPEAEPEDAFAMFDPFAESRLGVPPEDAEPQMEGDEGHAAPSDDIGWADTAWDGGQAGLDAELGQELDAMLEGAGSAAPSSHDDSVLDLSEADEIVAQPDPVSLLPERPSLSPGRAVLPSDWGTLDSEAGIITAGFEEERRVDLFLALAVELGAARVILNAGSRPLLSGAGGLRTLPYRVLSPQAWNTLLRPLCTEAQWATLGQQGQVAFFHELKGGLTFKVILITARSGGSATFIHLRARPPSRTQLGLPAVVDEMLLPAAGLTLIAAPPDHGKRTTLAALLSDLARRGGRNIAVIDRQPRFIFENTASDVHLIDPSVHAASTHDAIRGAVDASFDAIAVVEPPSVEALDVTVEAAATGVQVLLTLKARSIRDVLEFTADADQGHSLLPRLLDVLNGVIYQRLVATPNGSGALAAAAIPVDEEISSALSQGEDLEAHLMSRRPEQGAPSLVQTLLRLVEEGIVTPQAALDALGDVPRWRRLLAERMPPSPTSTP